MLQVHNLSFAYKETKVLKHISFSIKKGDHIALIGESGCGKSTLLQLIYGILDPAEGKLSWNNKPILGPRYHLIPGEESMKYLSQGFELLPYRTVAENIGYYLSNTDIKLKRGRVSELLDIVELQEYGNTRIEQLSGGQKQRVALAKALAKKPELLLLDEPFGNIDNFRRSSLRRNLYAYLTRNQITSITATHDQTDILSFASQTLVLQSGELIIQKNTKQLYQNPGSYYIASLFGEVNKINAHLLYTEISKDVIALIYPHEIILQPKSVYKAKVRNSYFNGSHYLIEAVFDKKILFIHSPVTFVEGDFIGFQIPKELVLSRILK
ncbi:ABC transporter ATP-binding protein [Aquimarina sp. ERC-38]|uniref:ABC transporter ATP-binding protein n=1 Tax=Aquimarina sp. ERC-38 TaxID=2949996 RepID=UPI002247B7E0|nr:ABC transporter ATP-binding protein [Aquimarina sp. ERC-38]UZO81746.1 ABC transporter ATP-binding protein [Aquimarina sp. ERC-38]